MVDGLLKIAEGCELIASGLKKMAEADVPVKTEPQGKGKKAAPEKETEPDKGVTVEKVRAVLAEKSRSGKTQEVRALLNEFGADKLSAVPSERLEELYRKAEVL